MNDKPGESYSTMGRREAAGQPVILQFSQGRPVKYRIAYAGSMAYFDALADAMLYMHEKWGFDIIGKTPEAWKDGPKRPIGEH